MREPWEDLSDQPGAALVEPAISECKDLTLRFLPDGSLWPAAVPASFSCRGLDEVLGDDDAASLLELCLGDLDPQRWAARSLLAHAVSAARSRLPIGDKLSMSYLD
ncbi:hypothetical protein CFN78_23810 [Amycolatopsis antarctica]|uniref:Uncharacterized protein n=1 Tax=Amycolatopsis antarctica TaxID=1854586 RepID=A0A263CX77_9PSEU|nr:hypothetical protein CFN78_23810 [Amycolatopsis antarctica]